MKTDGSDAKQAWIEARVYYADAEGLLCADIIANLFYEMGLHGVLLEDTSHLSAPGEDDGNDRPTDTRAVVGYIPDKSGCAERCERLRKQLRNVGFPATLVLRKIHQQDWSRAWKAHFKPLTVCPGLVIKPSWESYSPERNQIIIEMDPGMAFGTGHHPTTVMCLELIRTYMRGDATVLDVGTGTGILAIAAVKFGSRRVVAIDSDDMAVTVARQNCRRNRIGTDRLLLLCGSLVQPLKGFFHIVVANILPDAIQELITTLDQVMEPGGIFIGSGIPDEKADALMHAVCNRSYEKIEVRSSDGWTAFAVRRPR